jgi:hypothetical protein
MRACYLQFVLIFLCGCATVTTSIPETKTDRSICSSTSACSKVFSSKAVIAPDIEFESSDFILKTANRNPKAAALDLNENGAYGEKNKTFDKDHQSAWFIDNQKPGADSIIAGIYKNDIESIRRGLKIISWGFAQQKPDGSYSSGDAYHTVSYFLAIASRAILHLENSKYDKQFANELKDLKTSVAKTADWLTRKEIEEPGIKSDAPYTHRFYMNATAIGLSGILLNRSDLIVHSQEVIQLGLIKQNSDGSNPEKQGTDTSYHALGLFFAAQYYSVISAGPLRDRIKVMGDRGATWLASKVLSSGDLDSSSNTRTGPNGEKRYGTEAKTVTYFMIYKALAYWGQILDRSDLKNAAEKVFEFNSSLKARP